MSEQPPGKLKQFKLESGTQSLDLQNIDRQILKGHLPDTALKASALYVGGAIEEITHPITDAELAREAKIELAFQEFLRTGIRDYKDFTKEELERFLYKERVHLAAVRRERDENIEKVRLGQEFLGMEKKVPHPVWIARMPPFLRERFLNDPDADSAKDFFQLVDYHHANGNPIFTVSEDLTKIISRCDLDESLPCDYIKLPTPKGCYFNLPYATFGHRGAQRGFYMQPHADGMAFAMIDSDTVAVTFIIPQISMPLSAWFKDHPIMEKYREQFIFMVMLVFYCNCSQYRTEHRPEYTAAVREAGGKKNPAKRAAVLKKAQTKFDYVLIGPAQEHKAATKLGAGAERSPHFRRGHFRVQKYGPRWTMERLIFIAPCFVKGATAQIKDYIVD
jgi:hypothetical protein